MAWFTPVLGAVGSLASSALGGLFNRSSGPSMSDQAIMSQLMLNHQKELFDYQQDRLEKLYNSAHQREVEDLKAAGLNPILSANGGNGAGSGLAGSIDAGSAFNAAASMANTKANNKVVIGQTLLGLGEKLLDYTINKQNANSARMNAEANKMNALTNMNNSASQIDLNARQGDYFISLSNKTKDDLKTNEFIRKNYASQTLLNLTSAENINALQPSIIELNRANANATPLKIIQGLFDSGLKFITEYNKANTNSAKDWSIPDIFGSLGNNNNLTPRAKKYLEKIRNY